MKYTKWEDIPKELRTVIRKNMRYTYDSLVNYIYSKSGSVDGGIVHAKGFMKCNGIKAEHYPIMEFGFDYEDGTLFYDGIPKSRVTEVYPMIINHIQV